MELINEVTNERFTDELFTSRELLLYYCFLSINKEYKKCLFKCMRKDVQCFYTFR